MTEVWVAAAISVGGAVVSGYAADKQADKARKNANEDRKAATREEALYSGILSSFESEQEDYYKQLDRQRKQRGLDTFRQFSTTAEFAPKYVSGDQNIVLPNEMPNVANNIDAGMRRDEALQRTNENAPQGKKGKSGLGKLLDPLGLF